MLKTKVKKKISRVLYDLGISQLDEVREPIVDKFIRVQHWLRESSKYNTLGKLTPIIIYIYLTLQNYRIDKLKLITVSSISHSEFYNFFYQLNYYIGRLCLWTA
ncbi:hypothetical protein LCGC14_1300280 [marine sediment metagenome]|uniref:Uncharacterized protein n=1 Tax=marine sediment metagenome TaxID=412755 RepID=A0A0F9LAG0_9ZZZZ